MTFDIGRLLRGYFKVTEVKIAHGGEIVARSLWGPNDKNVPPLRSKFQLNCYFIEKLLTQANPIGSCHHFCFSNCSFLWRHRMLHESMIIRWCVSVCCLSVVVTKWVWVHRAETVRPLGTLIGSAMNSDLCHFKVRKQKIAHSGQTIASRPQVPRTKKQQNG